MLTTMATTFLYIYKVGKSKVNVTQNVKSHTSELIYTNIKSKSPLMFKIF